MNDMVKRSFIFTLGPTSYVAVTETDDHYSITLTLKPPNGQSVFVNLSLDQREALRDMLKEELYGGLRLWLPPAPEPRPKVVPPLTQEQERHSQDGSVPDGADDEEGSPL